MFKDEMMKKAMKKALATGSFFRIQSSMPRTLCRLTKSQRN